MSRRFPARQARETGGCAASTNSRAPGLSHAHWRAHSEQARALAANRLHQRLQARAAVVPHEACAVIRWGAANLRDRRCSGAFPAGVLFVCAVLASLRRSRFPQRPADGRKAICISKRLVSVHVRTRAGVGTTRGKELNETHKISSASSNQSASEVGGQMKASMSSFSHTTSAWVLPRVGQGLAQRTNSERRRQRDSFAGFHAHTYERNSPCDILRFGTDDRSAPEAWWWGKRSTVPHAGCSERCRHRQREFTE